MGDDIDLDRIKYAEVYELLETLVDGEVDLIVWYPKTKSWRDD